MIIIIINISDPDPPTNVRVEHLGNNSLQVFWNSPGCNGGPVRGVRIMKMLSGSRNLRKILETNQHEWASENGNGSALIEDYEFNGNAMYSWKVSVQYNFSEGFTWSQYSNVYYSGLTGRKFHFHFLL